VNPSVRNLLRLLVVALASGGALAQEPAAPAAVQRTAEERAAIELLRSLRLRERPSDAELVARLEPTGAAILPLLVDVLVTRQVPVLETGKPQTVSEIQEKIILLTLGELERGAVLTAVGERLGEDPDHRLRRAALACVGAVGRANDFPQLFELALRPEETELEPRLEAGLCSAVTAVLERDPRAFEQLVVLRRITRSELLPVLVRAVGASRDPAGLTYLAEVLYWQENLVLDVMSQVPLLGAADDEATNEPMRVKLRPYLDETRPTHCRAAVQALTALADVDSIAALIALLGSEDTGLRENAHWALKKLTGLALSSQQATWARWHQSELFWLVHTKAKDFQRLREKDPAVAADALRSILNHPLARKELVAALPELLKSRFPAIRVLACSTLGSLSVTGSVDKLVWALEDRDPEVVHAAHSALCLLTKLDLPRDPIAWQSATHTEPRGTEL